MGYRSYSPLAMVVEPVDTFVAISTMTAAFVHVELTKEAERLVSSRPSACFALWQGPVVDGAGSMTRQNTGHPNTVQESGLLLI